MSFSEKMRESLGATGVQLRITPGGDPLTPGATLSATVELQGGTAAAHVEALVLRFIEADRHWTSDDGQRVEEADAAAREDRSDLTAGWERRAMAETRVKVAADIDASGSDTVDIEFAIPMECKPSSVSCAHTLNVQADIKGQIDPTANSRIVLG